MKTIFMAFAIAVIGVAAGGVDAQTAISSAPAQNTATPGLTNVTGTNENGGTSPAVNARALKDFQKTFHDIRDESWSVTADGCYVAKFTSDFIKTLVVYNRKGVRQYTLHYYDEKNMPRNLKSTVDNSFCGYDILGAIEILSEEQTVYVVYLQDEKNVKIIGVNDADDIWDIQSFKRQ